MEIAHHHLVFIEHLQKISNLYITLGCTNQNLTLLRIITADIDHQFNIFKVKTFRSPVWINVEMLAIDTKTSIIQDAYINNIATPLRQEMLELANDVLTYLLHLKSAINKGFQHEKLE